MGKFAMWIFAGLSVIFLLIGRLARNVVLNSNECKMTYGLKDKEEIFVTTQYGNNRLFKYHTESKEIYRRHLHPQPVLFVPGHRGDVDQVRSLASVMHNKHRQFQYFVLDFDNANTAFHGSHLITQASYVNEALREIMFLYNRSDFNSFKQGDQKPFEIVVVGHSVGGMVARTSLLLDNHPTCVVKNMILLSTPIHRPPYSVDTSNDILYSAVNKAWKGSFLNESKECRRSASVASHRAVRSRKLDENLNEIDERETSTAEVTADWNCPVCARDVRVLSVSGGITDSEVFSTHTHLDFIAPRPSNISSTKAKAAAEVAAANSEGMIWGFMRWYVNIPRAIFTGIYRTSVGAFRFLFPASPTPATTSNSSITIDSSVTTESVSNIVANDTCADGVCEAARNPSIETDAVSNAPAKSSNYTATEEYFRKITSQQWEEDMMPYVEPIHFSVRTSQMVDVKVPVDHLSILWCHQVVGAISKAMRVMVNHSLDSFVDFNFVVDIDKPVPSAAYLHRTTAADQVAFNNSARYRYMKKCDKKKFNRSSRLFSEVIAPVAHYMERNESLANWRLAEEEEYEHVFEKLKVSEFGEAYAPYASAINSVAYKMVSFDLVNILHAYMFTSCLICLASLLRSLIGDRTVVTCWTQSQPSYHFCLDIAASTIKRVVAFAATSAKLGAFASSLSYVSVLVPFLIVFGNVVFALLFRTSTFVNEWGPSVSMFVCYGVALALRLSLLIMLSLIRIVYSWATYIVWVVLRWTVWCKPIRRIVRKLVSSIVGFFCKLLRFKTVPTYKSSIAFISNRWPMYFIVLVLVIVLSSSGNRAFGWRNPQVYLGIGTFIWCVLLVMLFVLIALGLIAHIFFPGVSGSALETPSNNSVEISKHRTLELVMMYWIVLPLSLPSVSFALSLLFNDAKAISRLVSLYTIFGPDRIVLVFALMAICYHLLKARYASYWNREVKPITWLTAMFNPDFVDASEGKLSDAELKAIGSGSASTQCLHEDGGKFCVLEETTGLENQIATVSRGILLGPTYRVIFCACYKDKSLKNTSEWCEWCQCKKCGGKHITKEMAAAYGYDKSSGSNKDADFNVDFGLLALLSASCIVILVYLTPTNSHALSCGLIAACFLLRDFVYQKFFMQADASETK